MSHLPGAEQEAIDAAEHDGEGWALPADLSADLRERLATKGLVRFWRNRWQLTPQGFAQTARFKADA